MKSLIKRLALCGALAGAGIVLANCHSDNRESVMNHEEEQAPTTRGQTAKLPSGSDQTANAPTTTTEPLGAHEESEGTGGSGRMAADAGTMDSGMGGGMMDSGTMGADAGMTRHGKHKK